MGIWKTVTISWWEKYIW